MLQKQIYRLLIMAVMAISLIYGSILYPFESQRYRTRLRQVERVLDILVSQRLNDIGNQIFLENREGLILTLERLKQLDDITSICVFDRHGDFLAATDACEKKSLTQADIAGMTGAHTFERVDGRTFNGVVFTRAVAVIGTVQGYIRIEYSLKRILEETRFTVLFFIALLLTILASVAVMLNVTLTRLVTRPLARLADAMDRLRSGDLGHRVDIHTGNELGYIADVFNHMSWENARMYQKLDDLNKSQEFIIADRTEELRQKNISLNEALVKSDALAAEADKANQAKSVFLATMSHELRTPLNSILGFSNLMRRDPNLSPDQRRNLATINSSGEHLLSLINDVLELSKIEAGRIEIRPEAFSLRSLLRDLGEMFDLQCREKGLNLGVEIDDTVPDVLSADTNRLRQVLINLTGNAVKFTQEGFVRVHAAAAPAGDGRVRLDFRVEDSGPGIRDDEIGDVFQAFVQTEVGRQQHRGTGLGVPISRKIVRLMGGDLVLSSTPGRGSVFSFHIPADVLQGEMVPGQRPERKILGVRWEKRPARILIAEDVEPNQRLLKHLLEPLGFDVRVAGDGRECVEVWDSFRPDLIFMDLRMPVLSGTEAIRAIRSSDPDHRTKIIALSASVLTDERPEIARSGCDDFLLKPFREAELFDMMERHLSLTYMTDDTAPEVSPAELSQIEIPARLSRLPAALVADFEKALELSDMDAIDRVIAGISVHDEALCAALKELADRFEYDLMLAGVRAVEEEL